jgi:hypothetical protein
MPSPILPTGVQGETCDSIAPVKNSVEHIAQSLIALHGQDALRVAEQAAGNARKPGAADSWEVWLAVIAEIKRIQKSA